MNHNITDYTDDDLSKALESPYRTSEHKWAIQVEQQRRIALRQAPKVSEDPSILF